MNIISRNVSFALYPHRKSPRLKGFDYSSEAWYFVTICTKDRTCLFGQVNNGKTYLSDMGQVVHDYWQTIPNHFAHVILGEMIVMPNHIHGIVGLFYPSVGTLPVGTLQCNVPTTTNNANSKNQQLSHISPKSGSLSHIVRTYKASCTHMIRQITEQPFAWQSRFHDRIIRNHTEMQRIENYIRNNPAAWSQDKFFTDINQPL